MTRLEIATLALRHTQLEGQPLTGLASSKVGALLYYLAVGRNRAVGHTYDRAYTDGTAVRFASLQLSEGGV